MDLLLAYLIFMLAQYAFYLGTETDEEIRRRYPKADDFTVYGGLFTNCLLGLALFAPLDPYYWKK